MMSSRNSRRFLSDSFFESSSPGSLKSSGRITAAATTSPAIGPRPASSMPATTFPGCSFSYLIMYSYFSSRSACFSRRFLCCSNAFWTPARASLLYGHDSSASRDSISLISFVISLIVAIVITHFIQCISADLCISDVVDDFIRHGFIVDFIAAHLETAAFADRIIQVDDPALFIGFYVIELVQIRQMVFLDRKSVV